MREMTSRERIFTALEGKVPDRVPLMEILIDKKVRESLYPKISYNDFIEKMSIDVVCMELWSKDFKNIKWINKDKKIYKDKWDTIQRLTEEFIPVPIKPARINTIDDMLTYTPPDPNEPHLLDEIKETIKRFKGKKALCFVGEAVLAVSEYLRGGLENLMIDFVTNPKLVKKLAKVGEEYYIELYRRVIDEGVEIILLGDDYAGKNGTFMSPVHFDEYILPGLSRIVKEIRRKGAYIIKHTDGNIWKIINRLIDTGVDALGPLEPLAGMDYKKIKDVYGNKICLVGNIDVDLLCRGTKEQVIEETKRMILEVSVKGGHILSSGNTITSAVNPENYMAMVKTAQSYNLRNM
jgi:uroporphyrinogen decarboxylase